MPMIMTKNPSTSNALLVADDGHFLQRVPLPSRFHPCLQVAQRRHRVLLVQVCLYPNSLLHPSG